MTQPPTIEYSPAPLVGAVTLRESGDQLAITLRPNWQRVFGVLVWPILAATAWGAVILLLWRVASSGSITVMEVALIPVSLLAAAVLSFASDFPAMLFPTHVELSGTQLTLRWRTLTEVKVWSCARSDIYDATVARMRIGRRMMKRTSLVVHHRAQGKVPVLLGTRSELELVAGSLRRALNVPEQREFSWELLPAPARCCILRSVGSGGVGFRIPPRFKRTVYGSVICGCSAGSLVLCYRLYQQSDGGPYQIVASSVLAVAIAGIASAVGIQWLKKVRTATAILTRPELLWAEETGLGSPMRTQWRWNEVRELRAVKHGAGGRGHLEIVTHREPPVVLAKGHRVVDLAWVVASFRAVRAKSEDVQTPEPAVKTESIEGAVPAPGNTDLPADDPCC